MSQDDTPAAPAREIADPLPPEARKHGDIRAAEPGKFPVKTWRMADPDARRTAVPTVAETVARASAVLVEAERQARRGAGSPGRDIRDIAGVFSVSNHVASATGTQPDPACHAQPR